jgi:hypothetical protein
MSRKRAYRELTDETHEHIVGLHLFTIAQIAAATGPPRTTVDSVVTLYKQKGQVHKKHKGSNHAPIISDAVKRLIIDLQSADHTLRLQDIHDALDVTLLDTPQCIQTIWNVLHAAGFTTKALQQRARETTASTRRL